MSPEWKQVLTENAWGLIRYVTICPFGGLMLMQIIGHLSAAITGIDRIKKLPTNRKIKCWLYLSALVMAFGVIYRAFSY